MMGPAIPQSAGTDVDRMTPGAENKDPEREVAEWVLSLPGGQATVRVMEGRATDPG